LIGPRIQGQTGVDLNLHIGGRIWQVALSIDLMHYEQPKNPLHGYTLEQIVISLSDYYGWDGLGGRIEIRCFNENPSVKSSLKFLRKTPWARKKVEDLFIYTLDKYGTDDMEKAD
jgi:uncharacterized protein (DUF2132 family)